MSGDVFSTVVLIPWYSAVPPVRANLANLSDVCPGVPSPGLRLAIQGCERSGVWYAGRVINSGLLLPAGRGRDSLWALIRLSANLN
jgi:hypothetical protein